ncbi:macro domain-containing protein [Pseudoalteromonas luteoviolacea]|uniref:macro domain-containing protein n=1 Tax=Pseudoalteromonas luteoviolacea TaxID=43657 RepID=UPI00115200BF|nr:macro domain-containing protein [Pseudoalteromonas luteoviolacea]TQF70059.1 phosphatase [Pseudoalteromonas luteoviolacea]
MKVVNGDLIKLTQEGEFDVIIHGCNCFCTMGAGIAKTIRSEFPEAYKADLATAKGDRQKLGTYSQATIERNGKIFTIINAYSQFNWRGRGIKTDYDAIQSIFARIKEEFSGARIGYPLIGAGLAGGDWSVISEIIESELLNENHTLVKFTP